MGIVNARIIIKLTIQKKIKNPLRCDVKFRDKTFLIKMSSRYNPQKIETKWPSYAKATKGRQKVSKYKPQEIERKWQSLWFKKKPFSAVENKRKKKYILVEFPYPSGAGLHMGHLRPYVAADVTARFLRLTGHEVLFPMGWDAFGLPAENYAIKMGVHPTITTKKNVANAKKQMLSWGLSFDWKREINTTDPNYYKWTQWLFLQFFKKGLAFEKTGLINWCPKDKTGLANEEVIDGKCERCGTVVEKKELRQWYLKITDYAEKLLAGLKDLTEWPEAVKLQQENWIGKKTGINITYEIEGKNKTITCFTTRPDTNFGATFIVIGPEHPLIQQNELGIQNYDEVKRYIEKAKEQTEQDRTAENRKKTGVFTGLYCINTLNNYKMPLYVADYVLGNVGTGAVVGVPGHDKRDFEFAQVFGIEVKRVVQKNVDDTGIIDHIDKVQEEEGKMVNSGFLNGLDIHEATEKIMDYMESEGYGKRVTNYKLRDWVFSRQRYWGEPIPLIHCDPPAGGCGVVAVPEKDLPVKLPNVKKYEPTGTGESPLAGIDKWVNTKCPKCKGPAKRETNTMPQWAGSSWYWLRYLDPKNTKTFSDIKKQKYWTPVDVYFGGMEHTTLHLLYSRFWNLFLYDQKLVTEKEPYKRRFPHGIILGPDGEKMSKSRGNVVDPQKLVKEFGADAVRMYQLFLGPHGDMIAWNDQGIVGVKRFLDRVWSWAQQLNIEDIRLKIVDSEIVEREINKLVKKITEDLEAMRFNTCISAFMSFLNEVKDEQVSLETVRKFLILLSPFAPHIAEELLERVRELESKRVSRSVNQTISKSESQKVKTKLPPTPSLSKRGSKGEFAEWPQWDESKILEATAEIIVQVNGKVKGKVVVPNQSSEEVVKEAMLKLPQFSSLGEIKRTIYVPNRLINLVI